MTTRKIGRDAKTGRIIPIATAQKRPSTTVIETVKVGTKSNKKPAK